MNRGGTSGIVTLEDVIQRRNRGDPPTNSTTRTSSTPGSTNAPCSSRPPSSTPTASSASTVPTLRRPRAETALAGFMVEQMAHAQAAGNASRFAGVEFVAEAVDRRRILQIRLGTPEGPETTMRTERILPALCGALLLLPLAGCDGPPAVPRPKGYFRIALHDTQPANVPLDCPIDLRSPAPPCWNRFGTSPRTGYCWHLVVPTYAHPLPMPGVDLARGGGRLPPGLRARGQSRCHRSPTAPIRRRRHGHDLEDRRRCGGVRSSFFGPTAKTASSGVPCTLNSAPMPIRTAPVVERLAADVDHLINALNGAEPGARHRGNPTQMGLAPWA